MDNIEDVLPVESKTSTGVTCLVHAPAQLDETEKCTGDQLPDSPGPPSSSLDFLGESLKLVPANEVIIFTNLYSSIISFTFRAGF